MTFIDPTYLRTTYDGLLIGTVHKDNASALPFGLDGMYEEAFPAAINFNERKKFLEFFAVVALLKKEVSLNFVFRLLEGWTEDQVTGYIALYSKWFNSPVSGRYVLYHDRLRKYILQRISHDHFIRCNDNIINECKIALNLKVGDEWEHYALEHLSKHLLINAMEGKDIEALKILAYNTTHWNRQVQVSKKYEWSKRMHVDMLLWASKYDNDEIIECMLNMVDIHHLEQMDAPRIVELVAQYDFETSLNRIETFGSNDQEGLKRKFLVYINCIIELMLSSGKNEPLIINGIDKILKHMDENIPSNISILNWSDFLPSYGMFNLACELDSIGLDYLRIFKRADNWGADWIKEMGGQFFKNFEVLFNCIMSIGNIKHRDKILISLNLELVELDRQNEARILVNEIYEVNLKRLGLLTIYSKFAKEGRSKDADILMSEYTHYTNIIVNENDENYSNVNAAISIELAKHGIIEVEDALEKFRSIEDSSNTGDRLLRLKEIANLFYIKGKSKEAESLMMEALDLARQVMMKSSTKLLRSLSTDIAHQGNFDLAGSVIQEALEIAKQLRLSAPYIAGISTELALQGKIEEANSLMKEALDGARELSDESKKCDVLKEIASELRRQDRIEEACILIHEALAYALNLVDDSNKILSLHNISTELMKLGRLNDASQALRLSINSALNINEGSKGDYSFKADISIELAKQGIIKVEDALENCRSIEDSSNTGDRLLRLKEIANIFYIKGKSKEAESLMTEALDLARQVMMKSSTKLLRSLSTDIAHQGNFDLAGSVIQEALEIAKQLRLSAPYIAGISTELALQGKIEEANSLMKEALDGARELSDESKKCDVLKDIASEHTKQGKFEEAGALLLESLTVAWGLKEDFERFSALQLISIELARQGNRSLSEEVGLSIPLINLRYKCWRIIAENNYNKIGCENALMEVNYFQNIEIRANYLKGLADSIRLLDATKEFIINSRRYFLNDINSIDKILRQHALHESFFTEVSSERKLRLNRTFNIQWASRIKSSFSVN
jgi:tetratricopeptide (TPR) repeat protein